MWRGGQDTKPLKTYAANVLTTKNEAIRKVPRNSLTTRDPVGLDLDTAE
jgi:hypothetical protein